MQPCGLVHLRKPAGITSRDAVNHVQQLLPRRTKIGHAGTLDPLASGVLVLAIGAATRLIQYIQALPKHYRGTFLLGRHSPTEDIEGDVVELQHPPIPTREDLEAAAGRFVGVIQQRPPAYSALKVHGRRAYDLARRNQPVDLAPRPITIHQFVVHAYDYPTLTLDIVCGSGTYIRSLGRDLAQSLGTEAVMSALVRTAIGGFSIAEAVALEDLNKTTLNQHLLTPLRAVEDFARVVLSPAELTDIGHGRTIAARAELPDASHYAAVDAAGRLVAILVPRDLGLGPVQYFPPEA